MEFLQAIITHTFPEMTNKSKKDVTHVGQNGCNEGSSFKRFVEIFFVRFLEGERKEKNIRYLNYFFFWFKCGESSELS